MTDNTDTQEAVEVTPQQLLNFHEQQWDQLAGAITQLFPDEVADGQETVVETTIRLLGQFAESLAKPVDFDPDELEDLRFDTEQELESMHHMILSGRQVGKNFGSYPVEFRGAVLSCISMENLPGQWKPLAMVMPDKMWAEVVPRSHRFASTKEGDK